MDLFTTQHLRELLEYPSGTCVSLFLPTHRTGPEIREDSLRCKNALQAAEEQLREAGKRTPAAKAMLEPAWQLCNDGAFWRNRSDGLAMFVAEDFFRFWRLPLHLDEQVIVNDRFHVRQMLPMMQDDGRFYVLAVSQNAVRLLAGSHFSVSEVTPAHLPKNLREALQIDEFQQTLQYHTGTQSQAGGGGQSARRFAMFHGQGGGDLDNVKRQELQSYFRQINHGLNDFFHDDRIPLVFAGVEYLFPIFRETCKYRGLLEEPAAGAPDLLNLQQLHARAWKVVEPHFRRRREEMWQRFHDGVSRELAATDLQHIISAARGGAIDTLFLGRDARAWGIVDATTGVISETDEEAEGSDELWEYAASQTLLNGGSVVTMDSQQMPSGAQGSALLRYPVPVPQAR